MDQANHLDPLQTQLGSSPAVIVLSNLDLLDLILACVPEYTPDLAKTTPQDKQGLLNISLTCKVFFRAAMGQLWNTMESFLPLLFVIPCVTTTSKLITTTRVINDIDLHRLEFYTRRIRHFNLISFKEKVSTHIYTALARFNARTTLLCALRSVHIRLSSMTNENLLCLPLIASSSSLSKVEVHRAPGPTEMHLASFMHDISSHHSSPGKKNFGISMIRLEGYFASSTLSLLEGFTQLSRLSLKLRSTDPLVDLLHVFSNLPSLAELALEFEEDDNVGIKLPPMPKVYSFQTLQTLRLGGHALHVLGILRSIHGESLSTVSFNVGGSDVAPNTFRACIESVTTMSQHLLHLRMVFPSGEGITLPDDFIAPLQKCKPQLRTLYIKSCPITRDHFRSLFERTLGEWSALESLRFDLRAQDKSDDDGTYWPDSKEAISLSCLRMVAGSCPKLLSLGMYMAHPLLSYTIRELTNLVRNPSEWTNQCALVKLVLLFGDAWYVPGLDDAMRAIPVARFIHNVYPHLRDVEILEEIERKNNPVDCWQAWYDVVVAMVRNFSEVREAASAETESESESEDFTTDNGSERPGRSS